MPSMLASTVNTHYSPPPFPLHAPTVIHTRVSPGMSPTPNYGVLTGVEVI